MKVVFTALKAIDADLAAKQTHLTNGTIRFGSGQKMSSRLGNVTRAVEVIETVSSAVQAEDEAVKRAVTLGAIKYSFLKHRLGSDIAFDVNESVSLEGSSGPYLQYAHARARSILAKAAGPAAISNGSQTSDAPAAPGAEPDSAPELHPELPDDTPALTGGGGLHDLDPAERSLARKLGQFSEVVELAVKESMPHHIPIYLYELAQVFNRFYEKSRVIGDEREALRLTLVRAYAGTLQQGLGLLGITAPDKL
jgi:arginyl-tRNA synthetase